MKRPWVHFIWAFRSLAVVASVSLALVGFVQATGVDPPPIALDFDQYLHRPGGAPADPINLVFVAPNADAVAASVHRVLGWEVIEGSPMSFVDQGKTYNSAWQLGMNFTRDARWHLRVEGVVRSGQGAYVLAAAHRDLDAPCGHVGGEFNRARTIIGKAFSTAGYRVTYLQLGNTRPGPQCDGSSTAGDGSAVVIDLNQH